jgi:uncharacterized membrane protein YGL010W
MDNVDVETHKNSRPPNTAPIIIAQLFSSVGLSVADEVVVVAVTVVLLVVDVVFCVSVVVLFGVVVGVVLCSCVVVVGRLVGVTRIPARLSTG